MDSINDSIVVGKNNKDDEEIVLFVKLPKSKIDPELCIDNVNAKINIIIKIILNAKICSLLFMFGMKNIFNISLDKKAPALK